MSSTEVTQCDGCGKFAPPGHNSCFPKGEWMNLRRRSVDADVDVCSVACLEEVAARLAGKTPVEREVIDLDRLYALPAASRELAAPPRPVRRPRKRPGAAA